jgi:hypothetical protein
MAHESWPSISSDGTYFQAFLHKSFGRLATTTVPFVVNDPLRPILKRYGFICNLRPNLLIIINYHYWIVVWLQQKVANEGKIISSSIWSQGKKRVVRIAIVVQNMKFGVWLDNWVAKNDRVRTVNAARKRRIPHKSSRGTSKK